MRRVLFFIMFLLSVGLFSQTITKENLEGKWKVLNVVKAPNIPQFKPLLEAFKKASFLFKKDGSLKLETENKSPLFTMMTKEVNESKWILGKPNQVKIGSIENKFTIMFINVKKVKNEIFLI